MEIDRHGNLSVREWEWKGGIGDVGSDAPRILQGESAINTMTTETSELSPTVMQ